MNFTYTLKKIAEIKRIVYFQFNNTDTISSTLIDEKVQVKKNQCLQIRKHNVLYFHSRLEDNQAIKQFIGVADLIFFVIHVSSEQIQNAEKKIIEIKKILNFTDTTFFIVVDINNCPMRTPPFLRFAFAAFHQAFEELNLKLHNILFTTTKEFINDEKLSKLPFILSIDFLRTIVYSTKKMTYQRKQTAYQHYVQYFGNLSVLSYTLIQKTIRSGIVLYLQNRILCSNEQITFSNEQQNTKDVILKFYQQNQTFYS